VNTSQKGQRSREVNIGSDLQRSNNDALPCRHGGRRGSVYSYIESHHHTTSGDVNAIVPAPGDRSLILLHTSAGQRLSILSLVLA
jgi:hypothetical protein